ncbi:efflux transporter outer membrane subunit [Gluconacetobacter tumulisoli]|uniref:Efflux transporter outer membrane subunit n=1 Tax=Gluconacetobacter tumulisoli TaxID=1286189 RepID=A0A7W4KAI1_9PROT|nr:efflux transporter outer membrane subunit [Gluconacetobacter tumulisoli]MBB2203359.1 efflux transporter outer membrane subunit [Gluconacetobacter tumulisoli]
MNLSLPASQRNANPLRHLTMGMRLHSAAALAMTLLTTACAVGPNYHAPATHLQPFHSATAVDARQAAAATPLDTWWEGFHDLELLRIEQRVLAQNLDLAAAIARVRQSRGAAEAATARLLPTLDFNPQASANRLSQEGLIGHVVRTVPSFHRDYRTYDVSGAASWEIDLFGGLRRGQEAARDEAEAAQMERVGERITVAADAADAYFQIRGDQARLSVAERQIAVDAHLLELMRQRRTSGVSNERELAQTEVLLQSARQTVPLIRIALEAQLNRLDVLMGAQPGTYAAELGTPSEIPAIPAIGATDKPTDMLRRRPDILAAERRLAASNARIGAALGDYYPKLSLSGILGFQSINSQHLFTAPGFQAVGSGAIRWRIFDFGKIDAEVQQARGANAEALARYQVTVLHAAEDIENAFTTLVQTEQRTGELQIEVSSLTRARDLSQQSFQAGIIPLTDVLDADRQLLDTQDQLALNQANAARAAVSSFRALGGGWPT